MSKLKVWVLHKRDFIIVDEVIGIICLVSASSFDIDELASYMLALSHCMALAHRNSFTCTAILHVNPFTLRVPLESIVCYSHTFENNLRIKQKFTKYLKYSRCLASD